MTLTLILFIFTILASLSVGLLMVRRSARSESWLERIEATREIHPRHRR